MLLITLSHAALLCNASELKLFTSSLPAEIWKLTEEQVETSIKRARALKEKWGDLAREQIQSEQSSNNRVVMVAGRSENKAQLFSEALERFIKATVFAKAFAMAHAAEVALKTKKREAQASVRENLKKKRASMDTEKRSTRGGAGVKPVAAGREAPASAKAVPAGAARSANGTTAKSKSKSKSVAPATLTRAIKGDSMPATMLPAAIAQPHLKLGGPVKEATVRAKQRAIAKSGLTSRTRGHISARGRRAQGKRDAR
jgi:hypothetical protein